MNKSALKNFATSARRELLERVELQARKIGITSESIQKAQFESSDAIFIDGKQLSEKERVQRNKLIARIHDIGFSRVMEETAYTWFNRFTALRFMEVNDYLPTKIRVLSSINPDSAEPEMMKEALSLSLDLDKEYIYELKMANNNEELFKYLIIKHCNDLNRYMPFMFETIDDYTEILFPGGLLSTDSFVRQMIKTEIIPEDNWSKVEIIGWLYQYYISEENERVIQAKKRYKAEELPFATQLFTPEWIVRYMVQNALGRYWVESHPEDRDLVKNWEFYLENQNVDSTFEENLAPYINKELKVEEIMCFDPAMGSGHILVYMFDVLFEIYTRAGYMEKEIPRLIIENNLYGLDIDDRAYQLASFSIVMKALEYNTRFLRSIERDGLTINLTALQETNTLKDEDIAFLAGQSSGEQYDKMHAFVKQFSHAKTIGSLIKIEFIDLQFLKQRLTEVINYQGDLFELEKKDRLLPLFVKCIKQAELMNLKYDVLITNPPYVGTKYLTLEAANYLQENYVDTKLDLFSSFIEYSTYATKKNGQIGFMSPFVWMFISSFEKLRKKIINDKGISSLVQLEYSGFDGATVPICTFTLRNYNSGVEGEYVRLTDFRGAVNQPLKTIEAVKNPNVSYRYSFNQKNFNEIPGSPLAYWSSERIREIFVNNPPLLEVASPKQGMATADNNRFLRLWFEVTKQKIGFSLKDSEEAIESKKKWFPYNKGGAFRKWYGNNEYIVNWENDGYEIRNFRGDDGKIRSACRNTGYYFKEGITWTDVSSSHFGVRYSPPGFIFDVKGSTLFITDQNNISYEYLLALLSSKIIKSILSMINPTISFQVGDLSRIPILLGSEEQNKEINYRVVQNIEISKREWDSFEVSWDFRKHPLIEFKNETIESSFSEWNNHNENEINTLKNNETELNRTLIEIYGLLNELNPKVEEKDVTIRKLNLTRDIKSFVSYGIGCIFGRYSLEEEGIIFAGGDFNTTNYTKFSVDEDNILPILPEPYFEDDIVNRFIDFIRVTFGEENLEENVNFIADTIERKKNETSRETLRRYFLNDFNKDHLQIYKKRPIYWLFTSGKEKAFNCLIYMHRYDKTTLSRIRTDYLHEVQIRMDAEKKDLLNIIEGESSAKEISNAKKELKSLNKKIDELKAYDEKLHHMADMQIEIDLDDGVTVNYAKFEGLVAKI